MLLTLNELSAAVKLPLAWLKREARARRIPALIVGRQLLFDLEAVRTALAKRAAKGGQHSR